MTLANSAAENILGTIGAVCWSVQLVPQIWMSWKRKDTAGLSTHMLIIWYIGGIFLGAFVILQNLSIPLIIQPQFFCFLSAICWAQCIYYDQGKSKKYTIIFCCSTVICAAGAEVFFYYIAKFAEDRGHHQVTTTWGVLSAVFIVLGLFPQYYEVFKLKAVIGVSLMFLAVDAAGGLFSTLSLLFAEGKFNILASISYSAVVVLEIGIFILAAILNPSHHRRVKAQQQVDEEALSGRNSQLPMCITGCTTSSGATTPTTLTPLPTIFTLDTSMPLPVKAKEPQCNRTLSRGSIGRVESAGLGWMDGAAAAAHERGQEYHSPNSRT